MARSFLAGLLMLCIFPLFAQNSEVKMNCRVLLPEEYGGNGYIISHNNLIDGAFVEVTNLGNLKKSTAVVRRNSNAVEQGVVSAALALNLGIPFNGNAEISVRYISFLKNSEDVYAPFYAEHKPSDSAATAEAVSETDTEESSQIAVSEEPPVKSESSNEEVPVESAAPVSIVEKVPTKTSSSESIQLPIPQWEFVPTDESVVLSDHFENPETKIESELTEAHLPDASLFELTYVEDFVKKEDEHSFETLHPDVDIERPWYVIEQESAVAEGRMYQRDVEDFPSWKEEIRIEEYVPQPESVTVWVNGEEIGLPHYPEIDSGYYRIVDEAVQVKRINPLFTVAQVSLPEAIQGVGVEDLVESGESEYVRNEIDEPQVIQIKISETIEEPALKSDVEHEWDSESTAEPFIESVAAVEPPSKPVESLVQAPSEEVLTEPEVLPDLRPIVITEPEKPYSPLVSGALYMQIGAFRTETAAEKISEKLNAYFPTVVFETEENGSVVYKVAVGPISIDEIGVIRLYLKDFHIRDAFPIIGR